MKQVESQLNKHFRLIFWATLAVWAVVYALFSLNDLVWADEAYTFALIRHSFADIWRITAADVHPPLYYFLLKLLAAPFGYDLQVCRLLSSLPCLLTAALGAWQIRKLFSSRLALLFMGLYLLFPYTMTYATEVRMYGLAQLMVTLCAIFAWRAYTEDRPRHWVLFAVFGTCAAYTHYFALVSAGILYGLLLLAILLKKRPLWKRWMLASLGTILLFLPWLGSFVSQLAYKVNNEYWIGPISPATLVSYVMTLFDATGMTIYPLFAGLAYVAALILVLRRGNCPAWLALSVPVATVAVGVAASILVRPVFVIRYILPSVPLLVFFFAWALNSTTSESLFSCLMTVAILGGVSNALVTIDHTFFPNATRISPSLVQSFPEYDAFLVLSGNTLHTSQELSYYDGAAPVYTADSLGPDNPYPNRLPQEDFIASENPRVILALAQDEAIPGNLLENYHAEHLAQVLVSDVAQDLWYLEAK